MIDYKTLNLGETAEFLAKGDDGEYTKTSGEIRALFLNSDDYISVQLLTTGEHGAETNHDVQIARLDTSDEMISKLKEADEYADTAQAKLDADMQKAFEDVRADVKAIFDKIYA